MAAGLKAVVAATARAFPQAGRLAVRELPGGGSDRRFYRVSGEGLEPSPMVAMAYTDARPDNLKFASSTAVLEGLGVRVPVLYHHDAGAMLMWVEDLGDADLWALRGRPWGERLPYYEAALREVAKLHRAAPEDLDDAAREALEPPFDEALYRWEQEYFFEHFVGQLTDLDASGREALAADPGLRRVAAGLAAAPRRLVHRDFQSQNLLLPAGGGVCIIDHQGLRPGLPEYDLASLLLDPYVEIPPGGIDALRGLHIELVYGAGAAPRGEVDGLFRLCAAQRLMQALGAYGNLGLKLGKPRFLRHVPAALGRLLSLAAEEPELEALRILRGRVTSA